MRRAADSIILNIAEGGSKESVADMTSYLRHALGSVKELGVQVEKVDKLGYLRDGETERLLDDTEAIGKMINAFMRKLREKGS